MATRTVLVKVLEADLNSSLGPRRLSVTGRLVDEANGYGLQGLQVSAVYLAPVGCKNSIVMLRRVRIRESDRPVDRAG